MALAVVLATLLSLSFADAAIPSAMLRGRPIMPRIPFHETRSNGTSLTTVYYFNQLIDHNNPNLGTFQQRYWMDWEFYEPGTSLSLLPRMR